MLWKKPRLDNGFAKTYHFGELMTEAWKASIALNVAMAEGRIDDAVRNTLELYSLNYIMYDAAPEYAKPQVIKNLDIYEGLIYTLMNNQTRNSPIGFSLENAILA